MGLLLTGVLVMIVIVCGYTVGRETIDLINEWEES